MLIWQKLKKSWWFRPLLFEPESDAPDEKRSTSTRLLILSGILAVVLQTTLLPHLPVIPDLLLVFCVYLAMYHCSVGGAAGSFLLGYTLDSCSGAPLGMNAFSMSLIFSVITLTARRLCLNNPFSVMFMIVLAVALKIGAFLVWGEFGQLTASVQALLSEVMIEETVSALVLTPIVFSILYCGEEFGYRA